MVFSCKKIMIILKFDLFNDPYYNKDYISLYLTKDDDIFEFLYSEDDKIFYNVAIKKKISSIGNVIIDKPYFDIESVYGYGGIYTNTQDKIFLNKAMNSYKKYCVENFIVAGFIRFNPFDSYLVYLSDYLDFFEYNRDIVVIDLTLSKEEIFKNYNSTTRNILRKMERDFTYRIEIMETEEKKNKILEKFIYLYYQTMDRNNASNFYYFDENYFKGLNALSFSKLFVAYKDNEVISMAYFLEGSDIVYYHLSANDPLKYNLKGNYLLLNEAVNYYLSMKKKYLVLGGGRTKDPNDSLFLFKRKFSKLILPFYVGGIIFMYDKYKEFCNISKSNEQKFLKYRV